MNAMTTTSGEAPIVLSLPFRAESAAVARHRVNDWLAEIESGDELRDDAQLVVSELVGNAVRHARPLADGTMLVGVSRSDDILDIAVSDGGSDSVPHRVQAEATDLAGRGLAIVEALSTRWWVESLAQQRTVHATLSLT